MGLFQPLEFIPCIHNVDCVNAVIATGANVNSADIGGYILDFQKFPA